MYWLKRHIPADIQPLLPPGSGNWVQESLRTSSDKEARRRRDIRLTELNAQWEALRRANNIPTQYLTPAELQEAIRLREELKTYPLDSVKRGEMLGLIQDRTQDIHLDDVDEPWTPSDKSGEFFGIATGETVFLKDAAEEFLANTRLKPSTRSLYKTVLGQAAEPPRDCRRHFRLSHAAMAACSIMA